ncbi:MAG TPA: membrane protein insertase YidC [Micropepsaceae bacterium]|nr:membrane protein insertase YidC [Micropepsaceae bacterium]
MSDQRNLLIAIVLSIVVVFGWQYLVGVPKPLQPPARTAQTQTLQHAPSAAAPKANGVASGVPSPHLTSSAAPAATARVGIDSPALEGSINLTGGRFDDLRLRRYRETTDPHSPEIVLLSPAASEHPYFAEFGWLNSAGAQDPTPGPNTVWKQVQGDKLSPGHDIELSYDNGAGLTFTRRISVDQNYMFTVVDSVDNHGTSPVTLYPYGLVNRQNLPNTTHYWVVHEGFVGVLDGILKDPTYADLAKNNDLQSFNSTGGWLGITDKYWMAASIPPQNAQFTATYKAYDFNGTKAYQSDFRMMPRVISPNGSQSVMYHLFAGAKIVNLVNQYQQTLGIQRFDMAIDWGWFAFITKPMFQAIDLLYRYVGNFGIAILIFTVFVKALFFPLANASYRSMSKMKKLQPEMERLRERFKTDKVQQQQELMKLYQKEKVNPVSGCLPMIIQIPVFFSLYKVLLVTIDMRHAPFFGWIRDLSAADPTSVFNLFGLIPWMPPQFLMIGVFPLIMGLTMWLQTNLNPPPADPAQQKIFGFMPIIFTFMMANFPVGLVIYWSWNNLLSIIQQVVIMRSTGTPVDFIDRLRGMGARLRQGSAPEKPAGPPD